MKKTKRFVSFILIAVLVLGIMLSGTYIPALADDNISADDTAKLVSDYADDRVLVVMTQTASRNFKTYTAADFPEVDCKTVRNLMPDLEKMVVEKINQTKTREANAAYEKSVSNFKKNLNVDAYRQILCLELKESGKANVQAAIKSLSKRTDVLSAGENFFMQAETFSLNDTYYNNQWALDAIQMPAAWTRLDRENTTMNMVTVGVFDSGISADSDGGHSDLNGSINRVMSRSFLFNTEEIGGLYDNYGHGTAVAGIIAAEGNNEIGVCGVGGYNPNEDEMTIMPINTAVRIISYQVMDDQGIVDTERVIMAIGVAARSEIPVINMSFGYLICPGHENPTGYSNGSGLYTAMSSYPGLFVCSAGNHNRDTDEVNVEHYPSEYDLNNVISVGACTRNYTVFSNSNYGNTSVDIFAPGSAIRTCSPGGGYVDSNGTSMAAPHVSAVAALIISVHGNLTPAQIKSRIINSVENDEDDAALANKCVSGGVLNAYYALYPYR